MKTIQICNGFEARLRFSDGSFFSLIEGYREKFPASRLQAIKTYKERFGCGLFNAKTAIDKLYEPVLLRYSDDGAILIVTHGELLVMRRIGKVWVDRGNFDKDITEQTLFGGEPLKKSKELQSLMISFKERRISNEDARRLFSLMDTQDVPYLISDREAWILEGEYLQIYTEDEKTVRIKKWDIRRMVDYLKSRSVGCKIDFAEF